MQIVKNYINGEWRTVSGAECLDVRNPATQEVLGQVPISPASEVDLAATAAAQAFPAWRNVPAEERVQFLFKLKNLLERNLDAIARTITQECGKAYGESVAEMRRAIENVEVACGITTLMQGTFAEDIATGIDEIMIRQPVGPGAIIAPFNFPGMIAFWYLPYALACGNTCVVKPSERVPLTMQRVFSLFEQLNLPKGVVNLVNGSKVAVDAILDHPHIRSVSFVGSSAVAKYVYARATANGKRAQCQGGAKNPIVVLPDADVAMTTQIVADSAFGCAGQRCLAASTVITVGDEQQPIVDSLAQAARQRSVGNGLDAGVQMGPVITAASKARIEGLIAKGLDEGASALVDGRGASIAGYEQGNFVRPTVLQGVAPAGTLAQTEIFGPVLSLVHAATVEDAIDLINRSSYGNMACLFTSSGAAARKFRHDVQAGNVGINIGVAAPMAFFPFSGWKESFFGDLHGQSADAVDFFTQKKVVVERWPKQWSRTF
jgi:malonate-semialdehyde dehydrogenase (acetylating) / methylmalonate-semialdehyde dehydrogenase